LTIAGTTNDRQWRTVDIVLGAVLGVAFGAVFQAWNLLWTAIQPAFIGIPPLQGFMYGVWLVPAVLVPLVIGTVIVAVLILAFVESSPNYP